MKTNPRPKASPRAGSAIIDAVRQHARYAGITHETIAARSGIHRSAISRVFRRRTASVATIERIMQAIDPTMMQRVIEQITAEPDLERTHPRTARRLIHHRRRLSKLHPHRTGRVIASRIRHVIDEHADHLVPKVLPCPRSPITTHSQPSQLETPGSVPACFRA